MTKKMKLKSLRSSTIKIFALMFIILIFSIYLLLNTIMRSSIDQLERKNINENMERVTNALDLETSSLYSTAQDWAVWDDTYKFIENGNEDYVFNNLQEDVFLNLKLNLMVFINQSGEYVFAKGMDFKNKEFVPVYPEMKKELEKSNIFKNIDSNYKVKGIIMLPEGPMLIASYPIIKSDFGGPVRGNVVFGRFLDDMAVSGLSDRLKLDFSLERIDKENQKYAQNSNPTTQKSPIEIKELSKDKIVAYTVLQDIYKQPALGLNVEMPRDVSLIGKKGINYMLYSLIAVGFIFIITVMLFLEKNILSRLLKLSKEVLNIGNKGEFSLRLKPQIKQDEIFVLSEEINHMLDKLEESEDQIRESEEKYRTFVEKGTDVIYSLNKQGEFSYISPNCLEVLGYMTEEIVGKRFTSFLHPDDKENLNNLLQNVSELKEHKDGYEYRMKIKNESWKWFYTNVSLVLESNNNQNSYIGIFYDIHIRKLAQEELEHTLDNLETKVQDRTLELSKANELLQVEIVEREKTQEKISHLAYHDHLTGLPNRLLFTDRLRQGIFLTRRLEKPLGVIFVDLDGFKMINDTMGHDQGDELLKEVANRLVASVHKNDIVSRVGGDEFIIMVQNFTDSDDITKITSKIIDGFKKQFKLNDQDFYVTASLGVALYPMDGEDVDTLIKNADIAMYKAKENGKNQYALCTPLMKAKVMENMTLTNSLYSALERKELMLYYQPQVSSASGKIIGLEALLRWNHPELGFVPPSKFIPIAEQTGLIMPIGDWVLKTACKQNKAWQDAGLPHLRMAVNLSVSQFQNANIVKQVEEILMETGLSSEYLELEITESIAMNEVNGVIETLNAFKKLGITISIDDFGTEYSSLSRLKQMPIDKIKIAMPFVQGIDVSDKDEAITKAIIVLAKNLGLQTIAEGVETKHQLSFLNQRMCDEIQGFYYYEPLPAQEIETILRTDGILKITD